METTRFYDVNGVNIQNSLSKNLKIALSQGFSVLTWYNNSDEEYLYLSNNWEDAENKAIEMYKDNTGYDDVNKEFYIENVTVLEIEEYLKF